MPNSAANAAVLSQRLWNESIASISKRQIPYSPSYRFHRHRNGTFLEIGPARRRMRPKNDDGRDKHYPIAKIYRNRLQRQIIHATGFRRIFGKGPPSPMSTGIRRYRHLMPICSPLVGEYHASPESALQTRIGTASAFTPLAFFNLHNVCVRANRSPSR